MTLHIQPDFSGLIPAGKKIQPQAPVPRSKAKTPGKAEAKTRGEQTPTKTKTRNRPAWMSETPPADDTQQARTITLDPADIMEPEQEESSTALAGIDYPRGGPQTQPRLDDETELALIQDALDQGMTVPALCRKYNISKATVQRYVAKAREEMEINSQVMDIGLIQRLEGASHQIAESLIKTKMDEVGFKDRGIVLGIILDKLKDLRGPRSGGNSLHLRAVFKGEGAIEIHNGQ
jgi:hypothetical protein